MGTQGSGPRFKLRVLRERCKDCIGGRGAATPRGVLLQWQVTALSSLTHLGYRQVTLGSGLASALVRKQHVFQSHGLRKRWRTFCPRLCCGPAATHWASYCPSHCPRGDRP